MTDLERIRAWVATYPGFDILSEFQCDFTDQVAGFGGIFPAGLVEVERRQDIAGRVSITNQYNFALYCLFSKAPGDDTGATFNADWVMDFQCWVQEQSVTRQAPAFGDRPATERISAQNGALYEANEGIGTYMVQLSVQFTKHYEGSNPWLI